MRSSNSPLWEVPYLPIDPADVGRTYEAVIRINSQSGKGGIAYLLEKDHGLSMPRRLQVEFSQVIQRITDKTGKEISPSDIWETFQKTYLNTNGNYEFIEHSIESIKEEDLLKAKLKINGQEVEIEGKGNGPIDAFTNALQSQNIDIKIQDYHQHAISSGSDAKAVAYIEIKSSDFYSWGVGMHRNTVIAGLGSIISALNKISSS